MRLLIIPLLLVIRRMMCVLKRLGSRGAKVLCEFRPCMIFLHLSGNTILEFLDQGLDLGFMAKHFALRLIPHFCKHGLQGLPLSLQLMLKAIDPRVEPVITCGEALGLVPQDLLALLL